MSPFLLIVLGALVIAGFLWFNAQPAARKGAAAFKLIFLTIVVTLVVLTVSGRIHWLGGAFAALLILFKKYGFLMRFVPVLNRLFKARKSPPSNTTEMSRTQALDILGLKEPCSRDDIIQAHRKLMQRLHPDQGGNTYLAAQLNAARDCLLEDQS